MRRGGGAAQSGVLALLVLSDASAKVRVVASIPDLASIAATVGGDGVEASSIARGGSDAHRVEVLPSYMVRVSRADLFLKVGLGLDLWADQIVDGSHNARVTIVDCSRDIEPLERPAGRVDARMGDVHPDGNPHYWLDPRNGGVVARTIAEALGRVASTAHIVDQARAEIAQQPPEEPPASVKRAAKSHKVRSGETLWGIAKQHGVRVADLRRWNGIRGNTIRPGQKLRLAP